MEVLDTKEGKDANISRNLPKLADFYNLSARELAQILKNKPFISIFKVINKAVF